MNASHETIPMYSEAADWESPDRIGLHPNEVHIWRALVTPDREIREDLEALLSPMEKARSQRFIFSQDRARFIVARGILRELLGAYTNTPPAELELISMGGGKPALRTNAGLPVRFNLSHSQNLAIYAFALGREVGIDLERVQPDFPWEDVAERILPADELTELRALPAQERPRKFFNCWTRMEAYSKGCGQGLRLPIGQVYASPSLSHSAKLESSDGREWRLCSFEPAAGFAASVAAEGDGWRPSYFQWKRSRLSLRTQSARFQKAIADAISI